MSKAEVLKKEILKTHSRQALRRIFGLRLDDELFVRVGKATVERARVSDDVKTPLAWRGYEYLMDSYYFDPALTKEDL